MACLDPSRLARYCTLDKSNHRKLLILWWRRGWDSNPRAGYPTRRFRGAPVTTTSVPLLSDQLYGPRARASLRVSSAVQLSTTLIGAVPGGEPDGLITRKRPSGPTS